MEIAQHKALRVVNTGQPLPLLSPLASSSGHFAMAPNAGCPQRGCGPWVPPPGLDPSFVLFSSRAASDDPYVSGNSVGGGGWCVLGTFVPPSIFQSF